MNGKEPTLEWDNDKATVVALRENEWKYYRRNEKTCKKMRVYLLKMKLTLKLEFL